MTSTSRTLRPSSPPPRLRLPDEKKRLPDEIDSLEKKIEKAEEARNTLVTKRAITNAANAISRRKKREADAVSTALGTPTLKRLKNRSKYAATPQS